MPVTKIKIAFAHVYVTDSADIWGDGEWVFNAMIDGKRVGNPKTQFVAKERSFITLPADWSAVVDVSAKNKPTDSVKVSFSGKDIDVIKDDNLGEVKYEFKYPFSTDQSITLRSPVMKGWLFLPNHRYYWLYLNMQVVEIKATKALTGPRSVAVSRQFDGSRTFTTVGGRQFVPRVEVCPIVPTPQAPTKLPRRPDISNRFGLTPGRNTLRSAPVPLWPVPNFNKLCNPSVIPILAKSDADFAKKVARLAVTYVEPGDLDTSFLSWHVKSGPVEIVGSNRGPEIDVNGTGAGATDELAELELRWDGAKGPLLCTYRAWVGKVKKVKYRINLINGTNGASRVTLSPADYENYVKIAKVLYWQAGIELMPDDNTTCWDGALTTDSAGAALPKGVFIVPVTNNTWTVRVNLDVAPIASRLNFRPGVIHGVFVRSTSDDRAAATDIQGVDGRDYEMGGKPTSSWVIPSGIPPDSDPIRKLKLKTFRSSNRPVKRAPGDLVYANARHLKDASFTVADMGRLYAAVLPSDWSDSGTDQNAGVNLAHEWGHVLGLHHRGSGDADHPPLSNDNINSMDNAGRLRGHPWDENIMTYGYPGQPPRAQDFDIIQVPILRKHPACT